MILACPLGTGCKYGLGGTTWKTQNVEQDLAIQLLQDHIKIAHKAAIGNEAVVEQMTIGEECPGATWPESRPNILPGQTILWLTPWIKK